MKILYLSVLVLSASLADAKHKETDSASVKFEFVRNTSLVVVPVFVNGGGPYRFLLDTGASHSVLSTALADKLNLQRGTNESLITAGGSLPVTLQKLEALQMGNLRLERVQVVVADFSLMGSLKLDGILGSDHLKSFNIFIDYSNQVLRIQVAR